jgi:hypothetical protein
VRTSSIRGEATDRVTEVWVWIGSTPGSEDELVLSRELIAVLDVLLQEFGPHLPAGVVVRHFTVAVRDLQAAGVRSGIAYAAEAMARARLMRLAAPEQVAV